ncbi:hypothetical protein Klosneuvirus_1_308 [Klosneuvirus KNV1]|uniref:Uncharacterized protein n=1 Tax=Klosneuvirus KNV1 TaxID=1977640 RepID=A0A1V0SIG3_9VIRU|nr:hypothetical protein Klosneuvirus_1_308 [Klosneuvirus KNV1]
MSRIQKYKESLYRFIKDKSCFMKNNNEEINNFIYDKIKNNDLIYSILLLTIMNNQNKKNHITMQGYYIATTMELLNVLMYYMENKNECKKYDYKIFTSLLIYADKSLQQNLESIKNSYGVQYQNYINMFINCMNIYNNSLMELNTFNDFKFVLTNKECNQDVIKWYLKKDNALIDKFKTFKQIDKESFNNYIKQKYGLLCELSITLGWVVGGGEVKSIKKLKKLSDYFATMYKIANDFENLTKDINKNTDFTSNYILNYGLQDAYETFMDSKQSFIEESMIEDIYTNTIKEIIDDIEANVDTIIDQTSPDLKSSYTTQSSKKKKQ